MGLRCLTGRADRGDGESAPAPADLDLRFDLPRTDNRWLFFFLTATLSAPRFMHSCLSRNRRRFDEQSRSGTTIPPAIRRALTARDTSCRFPGCSARYTEAHHVRHWADGGRTRLGNLVLLCRRHHRLVHEDGWTLAPGESGSVQFVRPDGRPLATAPAAPQWEHWHEWPLAPTDAGLAASGAVIDPWTTTPRWEGERLGVGWAIGVLRGAPVEAHAGT